MNRETLQKIIIDKSLIDNQENREKDFYNLEESFVSENEIDEFEDAKEKKIYLWLCLGLLIIFGISYLVT